MEILTAQFQASVEEFVRRTGLKRTEFGRHANGDPKAPLLDLGAFVEAVAGFHDSTAFEGSAKKAFDI